MRIIIFSGKGGSGVSTLAAGTAAAIAAKGQRTLAFGLMPGLSAALDAALTSEPVEVAKGLDALEGRNRRDGTDEFRDWLEDLLDWRSMEAELATDISALPGFSHVGRLLELEALAQSGGYDAIVVDAAPLEHFLELPGALESAARWLERLFAPRQQTVFEPFIRVFAGEYASTGEEVFERGRDLLTRLAGLRDTFTDGAVTTVRLVASGDSASEDELQAAVAALSLFSYQPDALWLNRMVPEDVAHAVFTDRLERQARVADTLASSVGMPVLKSALTAAQPRGAERARELVLQAYGSHDPAAVLHHSPEHAFEREGDRHEYVVPLPFARREELAIEQADDGVMVHLNGYRRVLPLPADRRYLEATGWALEDGVLRITFQD